MQHLRRFGIRKRTAVTTENPETAGFQIYTSTLTLSAAFATVALYPVNAAKTQPPSTPPPATPSPGGNAINTTGAAGANMSK